MNYKKELTKSMTWLGKQSKTIFIGQSVSYPGTSMFSTLENISENKKREVPIIEDSTIGWAIGLSLVGFIPIVILPRFNFLLLATNQIVNHLNRLEDFTHKQYNSKIIIRTAIGSEKPLFPGKQHLGDYTDAFRLMCKNIDIIRLDESEQIFYSYQKAYNSNKSSIIIEWGDKLNEI